MDQNRSQCLWQTERNWLNEIGFTYRKAKIEISINTQIEENEVNVG